MNTKRQYLVQFEGTDIDAGLMWELLRDAVYMFDGTEASCSVEELPAPSHLSRGPVENTSSPKYLDETCSPESPCGQRWCTSCQ